MQHKDDRQESSSKGGENGNLLNLKLKSNKGIKAATTAGNCLGMCFSWIKMITSKGVLIISVRIRILLNRDDQSRLFNLRTIDT